MKRLASLVVSASLLASLISTNGVLLRDGITQMITDDPAWASVHP